MINFIAMLHAIAPVGCALKCETFLNAKWWSEKGPCVPYLQLDIRLKFESKRVFFKKI